MKRLFPVVFCLLIFVVAAGAQAQATRTWVSGVGDDANPCSRTAPCKTFAGAISKTAAAGEINVLDPGGFGGVTITKSITISSESFEAGVLVSGINAIIVNALSTDKIVLRGLDIEGLGTGLNGIRLLNGSLVVENCTINNFTQQGIDMEPAALATVSLTVSNTLIRRSGQAGILVKPGASATVIGYLENVRLANNGAGLRVEDRGKITVRSSIAANNTNVGINIVSAGQAASIIAHDVTSVSNGLGGFNANGSQAVLAMTECVSANNTGAGVSNLGAQVFACNDNRQFNNGLASGGVTCPIGSTF